jgi:membrane protein
LSATEPTSRVRRGYASAYNHGRRVYGRGQAWVETRDPASRSGATIGWFKRYRAADGQLYAVLLSAYFFLTMVPLLILETSYVFRDPHAYAIRLSARLGLNGETQRLVVSVLDGSSNHKLTALVLAIVNLFLFGVGFGRVLQLAHARAWGLDLRGSALADQGTYYGILVALTVLTFTYVIQLRVLNDSPAWIGWSLDVGWLVVLVAFLVLAPWFLLHRRVPWRDIVPGALFTVVCFAGLRVVSGLFLTRWLNSYSGTYGSLGIVMAIFFWLVVYSTVLVLAAALSPALAHRRDLLRRRLEGA